jgi:hypothetical protein
MVGRKYQNRKAQTKKAALIKTTTTVFKKRNPKSKRGPNQSVTKGTEAIFRAARSLMNAKINNTSAKPKAKGLAMALCNPACCPNLRVVADICNADSTVATQLHSYATYKQSALSTAATYNTTQPLGTGTLVLFRDPLRSYVQYEANPNNSTYVYVANFVNSLATAYVSYQTVPADSATNITPLWFDASSAFKPHGSSMYVAENEGYAWFWLDKDTVLTVTQATAVPADAVYLYRFDGNVSQSSLASMTFAGGVSVTFAPTQAGYYNLEYVNSSIATSNKVSVSFQGSGDVYAQHAAPFIGDHLPLLKEARVNAASLMMSPVANMFSLNGSIMAAWLEPSNLWYEYTSQEVLSELISSRTFPFKSGIYSFLKPHKVQEFNYYNYTTVNQAGIITGCRFPLVPAARPVLFGYVVDPTTSTGTNIALGCEYVLTYICNLELVSNDQWHEDHLANTTFADFESALEAVKVVDPFHENPLHGTDIVQGLKRGFSGAKRHLSAMGATLSSLFHT